MKWTPSALFLAELSHVGYGILAVCLGYLLGFNYAWAALAWAIVTLGKEAGLDPAIEHDQPFLWAGLQDWAYWLLGVGAAVALFALHIIPR